MILLHTTVRALASVVLAGALVGCGRKDTRGSASSDAGAAPVTITSGAPLSHPTVVPTRDGGAPALGFLEFRGTVAGVGVLLRIKAHVGAVEGEYKYDSQKQYLALSGTLDASGHLLLDERNGTRVTGHFDAQLDEHAVQGAWLDSGRVKQFPVSLERWHSPPGGPVEIVDEHVGFDKPARRAAPSGETSCSVSISYERVVGLASRETQQALNQLLSRDHGGEKEPCDEGYDETIQSEVTWNGGDVLSVQYIGSLTPGGAHPLYTITDLVLDVRTAEPVELAACLVRGGEARLRKLLEARIAEDPEKDDLSFDSAMEAVRTNPLPEFAVRAEGLEFNFPLIYALMWPGHPYVVSWAELRPLLAPQCLLAPLATASGPGDAGVPDARR
jgi:hypothetical protein